MKRYLAALLTAGLAVSGAAAHEGVSHDGCAADTSVTAGELTLAGAFTRAMLPQARTAGGYLSITNGGTSADRLIGGSTEAAQKLELHEMSMQGEMMKMKELEAGIEIAPGATVTLEPGGLHLMLMGITEPFAEGECVAVTLVFEQAGEVELVLPVGTLAADAPKGPGH